MSIHTIEISKNTYEKITLGEQQILVTPMNRTIEKSFSTCPPEYLCLVVAGSVQYSRMTFLFNGFTTEKIDGKAYAILPIKNLQKDLF